jgi:hypothetical protein
MQNADKFSHGLQCLRSNRSDSRDTRDALGKFKQLGMNQAELAMVSGTGVRFISDFENGKETCEVGKVLKVLASLGLKIAFHGGGEGRE